MHLLLLGVLLTIQTPEVARQAQNGTASGIVRTASGEPAVGVRIAAVALPSPDTGAGEGALVSQTQTDNAGRYRLDNIPPGRYYIQAGLIDAPTYYPGATNTSGATSVLVGAGAELDGFNFTMSRGSNGVRIFGRVPTSAGRPFLVALIGGLGGTGGIRSTTAQIKTDGTFEFLKVTPGNYTLQASPSNGLPTLNIVVSDKDLDVGLPAGPGVKVSGTVGLGPRSPRPAGQRVILTGSSAWAQLESPLSVDGSFSITSVPPGVYTVKTNPGTAASMATIVVADRDIPGLRLAGYAELSGAVVLQDESKLPSTSTALMIEAKSEKGASLATAVGRDGTFRFPLLEGEYRMTFGKLPAGFAVKSMAYGSTDLLKEPLNLDGTTELTSVRVVLEKR